MCFFHSVSVRLINLLDSLALVMSSRERNFCLVILLISSSVTIILEQAVDADSLCFRSFVHSSSVLLDWSRYSLVNMCASFPTLYQIKCDAKAENCTISPLWLSFWPPYTFFGFWIPGNGLPLQKATSSKRP